MRERPRVGLTAGNLRGSGLHIHVSQRADVHACGAVECLDDNVDDNFLVTAGQPADFHRTLPITGSG